MQHDILHGIMQHDILQRHFARIGATLNVAVVPEATPHFRWRRDLDYVLDITQTKRGEAFDLTVREDVLSDLELRAVDVQPKEQHLLLMVKRLNRGAERQKEKFLCGHDERHWFVAAVPDVRGITNVGTAMEALKPTSVVRSQWAHQVKPRHRNKRRNAGFVRQGEWFFLPRPRFEVPMRLILPNEPLRRGNGKPHFVEKVYRTGGATVYVSSWYPTGIAESAYRRLIQRNAKAARLPWQVMRRNPTVYARGKVRHPDHKTIVLRFWHEVAMNSENNVANMVFLD